MLAVLSYYWPRLIVSLLFTLFSMRILRDRCTIPQRLARGLVFFFISAPVISIIVELFNYNTFPVYITPLLDYPQQTIIALFILYCIIFDILSLIFPIWLYSKLVEEDLVIAATMYFGYIIQDRFALILSNDSTSYIIIYFVYIFVLGLMHLNDVMYISTHVKTLNWMPVLLYDLALFVLMDTCYGAYYFFDELQYDTMSIPVIWLDTIIIISCGFSVGVAKLNIQLSRKQEDKLNYMQKFQDCQTDLIRDFATISEVKSGETGEHVRRVAEYSAILSRHFYNDEKDINYIRIASMVHDIGKLMVPHEIIEKKGKLTPEEFEIIKTHTTHGDDLLSHDKGEIMNIARLIAYEHHERWDGNGYPRGLEGNEISVYAQIVAVADVYDVLTSRRPYKEPWPTEEAKAEILKQRGAQFSPRVVDAFENSYDEIERIRELYADKD